MQFPISKRILKTIIILDPFFVPMQQVDKGAIRFVLSGANIMCPGLTSPGAKMTDVPKGTVVVRLFLVQFSILIFFIHLLIIYFFNYRQLWQKENNMLWLLDSPPYQQMTCKL